MTKMFNPGELNNRITFLKRNTGKDACGDLISTWEPYKSAWAKKFDLMGTDFYSAQTQDTKIELKFNCRYISGITKDMRILCNGQTYEIVGTPIDIDNAHLLFLIYCKAV